MKESQKAAAVVEAVSGFLHDHHDRIDAETTAVYQEFILEGHDRIAVLQAEEEAEQEEYADGSQPDTESGVDKPSPARTLVKRVATAARKAVARKR